VGSLAAMAAALIAFLAHALPTGASTPVPLPTRESPSGSPLSTALPTKAGSAPVSRHGGRSTAGVIARVLQRILALTTAIWLNDKLGLPVHHSLIAYDH
jgi:hypothetical protein